MCTECGGICCYADDSTYSVTAATTQELSIKLDEKFKVMSSYLSENRLCINSDKTHLVIMSTRQKKSKSKEAEVRLNTGSKIITPSRSHTLLGFKINVNMNFN